MITARARIAGITGWPVEHSRSPRLHGFWLRRYGIDGAYIPLPLRPEDAEDGYRMLAKLGFAGCNVTAPNKEIAFRAVDIRTPAADRMGAVNTIFIGTDGQLTGDNTDGFGFVENLRHSLPGWQSVDGPAVVVGAGGAARAIVIALLDAGATEIRLVNRTLGRTEALAEHIGGPISVVPWKQRADVLAGAKLLVNTTSCGMTGKEPLDLDISALATSAVVSDIVYSPLVTPLLEKARARGNPIVQGVGMLLHQGRPGFKGWFGVDAEVDEELTAFVLGSGEV